MTFANLSPERRATANPSIVQAARTLLTEV